MLCLLFSSHSFSAQYDRAEKMEFKDFGSGDLRFSPVINRVPPSNTNNCQPDGLLVSDRALGFNLDEIESAIGTTFDVNNLYFTTSSNRADDFRDVWLDKWEEENADNTRTVPPLNGYDWENRGEVYFCVGKSIVALNWLDYLFGTIDIHIAYDRDESFVDKDALFLHDLCNSSSDDAT